MESSKAKAGLVALCEFSYFILYAFYVITLIYHVIIIMQREMLQWKMNNF